MTTIVKLTSFTTIDDLSVTGGYALLCDWGFIHFLNDGARAASYNWQTIKRIVPIL